MAIVDNRDSSPERRDCTVAEHVRPVQGREGTSRIAVRPRTVEDIALPIQPWMQGATELVGGIWVRALFLGAAPSQSRILMRMGTSVVNQDQSIDGSPWVLYISDGTWEPAGNVVLKADRALSTPFETNKPVAWGSDWHYIGIYVKKRTNDMDLLLSIDGGPLTGVTAGSDPASPIGTAPFHVGDADLEVDEAWLALGSDHAVHPAQAVAPYAARDGGPDVFGRAVLNQRPSIYYRFDHVRRNIVDVPLFNG